MNYIDLINSFWDLAMTNPLSTGQVSLYFALLHICNRSYWTEWFSVPNQVLSVLTGLSRSGILKARNELKQRGLIDFKERGTKATSYKLVMLHSKQESTQNSVQTNVLIANSKQVSVQDSEQNSKQIGMQNSEQNSSTLYKTKDKTKEKRQDRDRPPISPTGRFEEFFAAYPKKTNRLNANAEYVSLLQTTQALTEDDLIAAAKNYAKTCQIENTKEKYIKNPNNWLKESVWVDYLPKNYKGGEDYENTRSNHQQDHERSEIEQMWEEYYKSID